MALGTAPHRVAPGVWATRDGRRLTPQGSAWWEHHHQQGLVTTDGHTTPRAQAIGFGKAIAPTRSVLPAPPPARHPVGQPTITPGQWAHTTPKQKMATEVTVTLSARERDRIAKQQAAHPAPKGYRYGPIPTRFNQPIGFGGASAIDREMAVRRMAEAAARREALSKAPPKVEFGKQRTRAQRYQAALYEQAHHPGYLGSVNRALNAAGDVVAPVVAHITHLDDLAARIKSGNLRPSPSTGGMMGSPIPGVSPTAIQAVGGLEHGLSSSLIGPDLTKYIESGKVSSKLGLAVDTAGLLPLPPIGKGLRALRGVARASKAADEAAKAAKLGWRAVDVEQIPERITQAEGLSRLGIPDEQVKEALAWYDNQAALHPGGPEEWWRTRVGHPSGQPADQSLFGHALYQGRDAPIHPETPEAARAQAKIAAKQSLGRMPRISGMTPQLWDLIRRGAPFRDWYQRGAGVIADLAERKGISKAQAAAVVAITSQQANPTFNLRRAAEIIAEHQGGGINPKRYFAGQPEKVAHVLDHPETFNWDGLKTNSYFSNFLEELDPAFYKRLFGDAQKVTVDRHIANMILGKKSVTDAQYKKVEDLFVRAAEKLGWAPKEVQAAAWVPWKAEQMGISQQVTALSREMAKRGEIPAELLGTKGAVSKKRSVFVREAYETGRRAEGHVARPYEHYMPAAADAYEEGQRQFRGKLYQRSPASALPKGATEFLKDGGSRVHFFEGADISTVMHELFHISMPDMRGSHMATLADEFAGGKDLAHWTDAEHEAAAQAFEQWIRTGEITNPKLKGAFNAIKEWMLQIVGRSKEAGMVVPKDVEDAFNHMFRKPHDMPLEQQAVKAAKRSPHLFDVQNIERKLEFGKRVSAMQEVPGEGMAGHYRQLEALSGELPRHYTDDLTHLTPEDLDYLREAVNASTKLKPGEKIHVVNGLAGGVNRGEILTPAVARDILKMWAPPGTPGRGMTAKERAWHIINEVVNIPRSIMASGDASGVFRQALVAFATHPIMVGKEMGPMFHYLLSEKKYLKDMEWLKNDPKAQLMAAHGTEFTDLMHHFSNREEQFTSSYAEWITGGKHGLVRRSGRAYTGLLNNVRYALNDNMYRIAEKQGMDLTSRTPEMTKELQDMSRVANWATGRGHLGDYETQKMLLNTFLFSPRLLKSRLDMLNPFFYTSLSPIAQREALRSAVSLVMGGMGVLAMAKLSGIDVVLDPYSSDFGKMKIGNHRFDVWGGHQQIVRTIAQEIKGEATSTTTGTTRSIHRGFPTLKFARGKLSPPVGLFVDQALGKTAIGTPVNWTGVPWDRKSASYSHLTPLAWQDADRGLQG